MKKYNVATKNTQAKWRTFMYGVEFDNGGISVKLTEKKLAELNQAIASGELVFDEYGAIQFSLFEDNQQDVKSKHQKQKQNGYQPESGGLKSDNIPF